MHNVMEKQTNGRAMSQLSEDLPQLGEIFLKTRITLIVLNTTNDCQAQKRALLVMGSWYIANFASARGLASHRRDGR